MARPPWRILKPPFHSSELCLIVKQPRPISTPELKESPRAPPGQLVLALAYLVQSGKFLQSQELLRTPNLPLFALPCHSASHRAGMQRVFTSARLSAPPQGNLHHSHRECRTPHQSRIHHQSPHPLAPSSPHPQGVHQLPS